MAFVLQDILHGLDFTGFASATAVEHNQLIDQAEPMADKSINLWSVDTALNVPDVPDPTFAVSFNKWKRYLWLRIPHSTATNTKPIVYAWNDNIASDATYLKWLDTGADTVGLQAQINTALADASSAQTTANNANTAANTAGVQAAAALANSNTAITTANTATANASTALANANNAQLTANNALANASAANTEALSQHTPNVALVPGTANQEIRTNAAGTGAEWFSRRYAPGTEYALATGVIADVAHGLGSTPLNVRWVLICKTAEFGFAINDEVPVEFFFNTAGNEDPAFIGGGNTTNVFLVGRATGNNQVNRKDTGAKATITDASWKAKAYATL